MERAIGFAYRIPAGLLSVSYGFGMLFFISSVSWYKAIGPILFLYIAIAPAARSTANRVLSLLLVVAYSPIFIKRVDSLFPFVESAIGDVIILSLELFVIVLFLLAVWGRDHKGSKGSESHPSPADGR